MRILIEEYQYNVDAIKDVLYGIDALENVEGKVSIHYVGYYYGIKEQIDTITNRYNKWLYLFHISSC